MDEIIDKLQRTHEEHIKRLKDLHETETAHLNAQINSLKQESAALRSENEKLTGLVEEMSSEVEGMRNDFELIQGRLGKIIVAEDDLVRLVELTVNTTEKAEKQSVEESQSRTASDTLAIIGKYLKKLEGSDPLHLCRLLEIPFNPPDRAFSLSSSLLKSIDAHITEDPTTVRIFRDEPVAPLLLKEIIKLRMKVNDVSRCFMHNSKKSSKLNLNNENIADVDVVKWLVDEHANAESKSEKNEFNPAMIISSFLSKFK